MIDHTLWLPYTQMQTTSTPIEIVASEQEYLITKQGTKLIDAIGSWWTSCYGYNHPTIVKAIQSQAETLPHVMLGGIVHPQVQRLAHRLKALLPADLNHVFFANTGSEAVEIAMKIAIQYWLNQGQTRTQFVCFEQGYHGDTFYAMSVCDPVEGMHHIFQDALPKQLHTPIPRSKEALEAFKAWLSLHKNQIAGVIIEPLVQGAGGMKMHTPQMLKEIDTVCKELNLLLIADEIFTGFGRTGSLFAINQAPIVPDIVCLSKALTGGTLPLAAVVARTPIYEAFLSDNPEAALMHGPTYMGNAIACAAANAVLELFNTEAWQENVQKIQTQLQKSLAPLSNSAKVKEVRVLGAIGVVELQQNIAHNKAWFVERFLESGIWLRPFGNIIYTTPCFNIKSTNLQQITEAICQHIHDWKT